MSKGFHVIKRPSSIVNVKPETYKHELILCAPVSGELTALASLPDIPTQTGIWGEGVAIRTRANNFVSPVDGIVESVDIANQQWVFKSKNGLLVRIQIGPVTQPLYGERLKVVKRQNQSVKRGEIVSYFDPLFMQKQLGHCYCIITVINRKGVSAIETDPIGSKVTTQNPVIRIYL